MKLGLPQEGHSTISSLPSGLRTRAASSSYLTHFDSGMLSPMRRIWIKSKTPESYGSPCKTIRARRSISVDNQLVINRSCTYKSALCQVMPSFMLSHNHCCWPCADSVVVDFLAVRSALARLGKSTWHGARSRPTIITFGHAIACDIGHKPDPVPI